MPGAGIIGNAGIIWGRALYEEILELVSWTLTLGNTVVISASSLCVDSFKIGI